MIEIDKNKSAEFLEFLKTNGKSKEFWEENKRIASTPIDKEALDKLFEDEEFNDIRNV